MSAMNWGMISDGGTFESLMHCLLYAEDPDTILFGRPGKDAGQDARSQDGKVVYQAKYRAGMNMTKAVRTALDELEFIKKYREEEHANHRHWEHAEKWVMVANLQLNPNDHEKWEEEVVPEFEKEGLTAEYWSRQILEGKLNEHPEIRDVFFEGENRVLTGLQGAREFLRSDYTGTTALDIPFVGREDSKVRVQEFVENSEKRILPITGTGGVGKTRMLYEALEKLSQQGWRVLWGLPESMRISSSWFRMLNGNQKTIIALDNPDDLSLVRAVLEQLRGPERADWKVLLGIPLSRSAALRSRIVETIMADGLKLEPLDREHAKTISTAVLGEDPREEWFSRAYEITKGNPGWTALVTRIAGDQNPDRVPGSEDAIALRMADQCLDEIPEALRQDAKKVLRWLAVWGVVSIEDRELDKDEMVKFLNGEGVSTDTLLEILDELCEKGLVHRWGIRKRLHAVNPPFLRHAIVFDWLLVNDEGEFRVSREGSRLAERLMRGEIPFQDQMLKALTSVSVSRLEEGESERFLGSIFDEIESKIEEGGLDEQLGAIAVLEKLTPSLPERALEIYRSIRLAVDTPPIEKEDWFMGKVTTKHEDVVDKLPWQVFQLCAFIDDSLLAGRALAEFRELVKRDPVEEPGKLYVQTGEDASKLLDRLLCREKHFVVFARPALSLIQQDLENEEVSVFTGIAAKALMNPMREFTEWTDKMVMTFYKRPLIGFTDEWSVFEKCREAVCNALKELSEDEQKERVWKALQSSHEGLQMAISHERLSEKNVQMYQDLLIANLEFCKERIEFDDPPVGMREATVMRDLWSYHRRKHVTGILKEIANACEEVYDRRVSWQVNKLFRHDSEEELNPVVEEVIGRFSELESPEALNEFFTEAEDFVRADTGRTPYDAFFWVFRELAFKAASIFDPDSQSPNPFTAALLRVLESDSDEKGTPFQFATQVAAGYLYALKSNDVEAYPAAYTKMVDRLNNKAAFVWEVLSQPHSARNGELLPIEFSSVVDLAQEMESLQVTALAGYLYPVDPEQAWNLFLGELDAAPDVVEKSECMARFIKSLHLTALRYEPDPAMLPLDQILNLFTEQELDGKLLAFHELEGLRKMAGYRLGLPGFTRLLQSRIDIADRDSRPYRGFDIMPHRFKIEDWVEFDPNTDSVVLDPFYKLALGDTIVSSHWMKQYVPALDPELVATEGFVRRFLTANPTDDDHKLLRLSALCAYTPDSSDEWKKVASLICQRVSGREKKFRERVYFYLSSRDFGAYTSSVGEVADRFPKRVEECGVLLAQEQDSALLPYRKWALASAEAELKYQQGLAEEDANA